MSCLPASPKGEKVLVSWKREKEVFQGLGKRLRRAVKKALEALNNPYTSDWSYRKHFLRVIGVRIWYVQLYSGQASCAFCSYLKKAGCHPFCYRCSREVNGGCGLLLPMIIHSQGLPDGSGTEARSVPWVFRGPCGSFKRLPLFNYFKHFNLGSPSERTYAFEVLEGLFTGLTRGKRPCHICASVNIKIYKKCQESSLVYKDIPCSRTRGEISRAYGAVYGQRVG